MNDFTKAWLVMICIMLVFFMAQLAINHENPDGPQIIGYDSQLGSPGSSSFNPGDAPNNLPNQNSVQSGTGSNTILTDPLGVIWGWFLGIPGGKYLAEVLLAPYTVIMSIANIPDFAALFCAAWDALIILLTILMITWRG